MEQTGQAKCILIVDDDPVGRAMLGLSLRQAGFQVAMAAGGQEALDFLARRRCRWMITDAKMSPMDGFELSRRAKQIQPDLHVVMMSALYTERDAAGYPIERFFLKPVHLEDLRTCVSA